MSSNLSGTKVSSEVLRGPRLKAKRAEEHIHQILAACNRMPSNWFDFSIKPRTIPPHAQPTRFELTYSPLKPVPEFLALMIGDAAHNLRSALDHLATGIIRTKDPKAMQHFPICKNRDDLINDKRISQRLSDMEAALPGSERLVLDEIRPVNNTKDYLWSFHDINNNDKHNLIIPTVAIANIGGLSANIGGSQLENCGAGNNAAEPFVAISSNVPFALQGDPQATIDVSFGLGTPFNGEPVGPTLLDVLNVVSETINAFERLILAQTRIALSQL